MKVQKVTDRIGMPFFLVILMCFLIGCAASQGQQSNAGAKQALAPPVAPNPNILRVGVSTNAPPLIYKQGFDIVGLEAELAKKFGEYLGRSIAFVEMMIKENKLDPIINHWILFQKPHQ